MNQSLKAMMVAGVVAMGLPVLTAPADAQPVAGQWNSLIMESCILGAVGDSAGANTPLEVNAAAYNYSSAVYNYPVTFTVYGGQAVILSPFCEVGGTSSSVAIYAFYNGPNSNPPWGPFSFWPALNAGKF
jgi:hypothetical protein